jgi:hypothetical protein
MEGNQPRVGWPPPGRMRLAWTGFVVLWIALLIPNAVGLLKGQPDTYHNEHWRGATLAGGGLVLALSNVTTNRKIHYVLLGASYAILGWSLWLIH